MIVLLFNISGRTDVVNYYSTWLLNRLEEGYVYSRNPYNKRQVTRYDLNNETIDSLVFCSKNYKPLLDNIDSISNKYPIICYYTITTYGKDVEPKVPSITESIDILKELSEIIGKNRIVWRFDPILFTDDYTLDSHIEAYEYIAQSISSNISFSIFSFVDMYKKLERNMPEIKDVSKKQKLELIKQVGIISNEYDLPIHSCLINENLRDYGVINSGCVTTDILEKANDIKFKNMKHQGMRKGCHCIRWNDFGMYNTCINGCKYCYANKNPKIALHNYKKHDENSPLLIGYLEEGDNITEAEKSSLLFDSKQTLLF